MSSLGTEHDFQVSFAFLMVNFLMIHSFNTFQHLCTQKSFIRHMFSYDLSFGYYLLWKTSIHQIKPTILLAFCCSQTMFHVFPYYIYWKGFWSSAVKLSKVCNPKIKFRFCSWSNWNSICVRKSSRFGEDSWEPHGLQWDQPFHWKDRYFQ